MNFLASNTAKETNSNKQSQQDRQSLERGVSKNVGTDAPQTRKHNPFNPNLPVSQVRPHDLQPHVSGITIASGLLDDRAVDPAIGSLHRNPTMQTRQEGSSDITFIPDDQTHVSDITSHSAFVTSGVGNTKTFSSPMEPHQEETSDSRLVPDTEPTASDGGATNAASSKSSARKAGSNFNPQDSQQTIKTGFFIGDELGGVQGLPNKKFTDSENLTEKDPKADSRASQPSSAKEVGSGDQESRTADQGTDDDNLESGIDSGGNNKAIGKKPIPLEVDGSDETPPRKNTMRRRIIICLILALLAGGGVGYYFYQLPQDTELPTTAPGPDTVVPILTESNIFPLLRCQGDCDVDMDCQDGLYCFQRYGFEPVPGCVGEDPGNTDYCIPRPEGPSIGRYGERLEGASSSRFGSSVSQSKNGQILAVAGSDYDSNTGYVNIYESQPGKTWDLMATLVGDTDGGRFGSSVALSADGGAIVVGSQLDSGFTNTGSRAARAQVFSASSDFRNWTLIGNEIIGDEYDADEFKFSVDISGKGDYVALGQPNSNSLQGGAAIYRNKNGQWTYIGSPFSQFQTGSTVKLSETAAGNLRVAANGDNSHIGPGQVYVLELETSTGVWSTIGQSLGENVGAFIALSDDGSIMAISITNRRSNASDGDGPRINGPEYVLVYQYSEAASRWVQFGNLLSIPSSDVAHLPLISLSQDGLVLAVAEPWYNDNDGRVKLHQYNSRSERWELLDDELVQPVDVGFFGASLSLVGPSDNFMLTVGAPFATVDGVAQGYTWSYQLEPTRQDPQSGTITNPTNPNETPTSAPSASTTTDNGSTLEAVVNRGLKCGIMLLPGRATSNPQTGELEGLSIDLCLALAAAAGVASSDVAYVQLSTVDRFEALQSGRVDVLLTSDTITMQRTVFEPSAQAGLVFSTPYLYSGSGFAGRGEQTLCVDRRDFDSANCTGMNICVVEGTTHQDDLEAMVANKGVNIVLASSLAVLHSRFRDDFCDVIAGDQFDISEQVARQFGYSGDYVVGSNLTRREPLGIVTRQGDPRWSDFVNWVLQATFRAEELGVLQVNSFSMPTTDVFGPSHSMMFNRIIAAVGNFGEMYTRNVEAMLSRSAINQINDGSTGLISPLPLGRYEISGPSPPSESRLEAIKTRGYLNCGISRRPIFAYVENGEYAGFDVDFCRAIAAAIFSGRSSASVIRYVDLDAQERFSALVDGTIDVLSRLTTVNLQRDVLEATTGVGFDFTVPNYYDGLSFGGVPSFVGCADDLDFRSSGCQELKICVVAGTTFEEKLREIGVKDEFMILQSEGYLVAEGLRTETCNVVAGGVSDLLQSNIDAGGYFGDYQVGGKIFSKDPLALVTLSDDHDWSNFVSWVVQAIFYADEQGISSNDAVFRMPVTNLFGPDYSLMLRDAVVVVGSYQDIYNRHFLSELGSRRGLNLLANMNPQTPLIYPLPGI